MRRFWSVGLAVLGALIVGGTGSTLRGAFTTTGDVEPVDPAGWKSGTTGYVGRTADGSLTVDLAATSLPEGATWATTAASMAQSRSINRGGPPRTTFTSAIIEPVP